MYSLKFIFPFFFFLFCCSFLNSQILPENWKCGVTESVTNPPNYSYKPFQTPVLGQPFKIMIVYVTFANDESYPLFDNFWWPPNVIPQSPRPGGGSILAGQDVPYNSDFMNMYPEYSISDYFCEMSMGKFDVVGDEYIVNLPEADTYYSSPNFGNRGALNHHVLNNYVDQVLNVNFADYDNWDFNESTNEWDYVQDGIVDMIVVCYRNLPNGSYWLMQGASGWWDLKSHFTVDGKTVYGEFGEYGSGVTVLGGLQNYSNVTGAIQHEIFHYLMHGNGTYINHGSSGLMTGLGEMSYCMNPWERTLGYIGWTNTTNIQTQGIYDYTLQDYIKGGEILKVVLPNTTDEEFYIVNSQRISMYDGIIRGGNDNWVTNKNQQNPYCATGKGIYIYHHSPLFTTTFELCGTGTYEREFDLENAEGKYEWIKVRDVNYYVPGQNFTIPLFEPLTGNVISGKEETHHWIKLSNACMQKEVSDDPCNLTNDANDYIVTVDDVGDEKDAFNYGYDEIFSPYSNPSTHSVQDPNNVQPLTIKITGRNKTTGNISVRIYYDNESQALTDLPPSKPKNLKSTKHVINQQTLAFHPKLTWDSNREPDFNGELGEPGFYRIYRGYLTSCDPDIEPEYTFLTRVDHDVTQYIDQSVTLYDPLPPGTICPFRSYSYKIEAVDMNNDVSLKSDRAIINGYLASGICENYSPFQGEESKKGENVSVFNYPNPFNPSTQIKFNLTQSVFVTIKIYNAIGQEVAQLVNNEYREAGNYSVVFDGSNHASGIYFYSIEAGEYKDIKKMVLIK